MSGVKIETVLPQEEGLRLDRWFRTRYPALTHGQLQRLLRTGQVRLNGGRVKANVRVEEGQEIRLPPSVAQADLTKEKKRSVDRKVSKQLAEDLKSQILFEDERVFVLNKPPGLAVQGGSGTDLHVDGVLDFFAEGEEERPRLVHRLDRDTSGVLVLARSRKSAQQLGKIFASHESRKIYWALVVGEPAKNEGFIDAPLSKGGPLGREQMRVDGANGKAAKTRYRTIDTAGRALQWLELEPLTGRTHQLRVHCAAIGTPILGDHKYGGADASLPGEMISQKRLHLHARSLSFRWPDGRSFDVSAPMPEHMKKTCLALGFSENDINSDFL